jgi:hypothetical protein
MDRVTSVIKVSSIFHYSLPTDEYDLLESQKEQFSEPVFMGLNTSNLISTVIMSAFTSEL